VSLRCFASKLEVMMKYNA